MNHFDAASATIRLDGNSYPTQEFLSAGAQQVAQPLRTLAVLVCCLLCPILAMYWVTLVHGPQLALLRWGGGLLIGPGAIAVGCLIGAFWRKPWAVVVEHPTLGYQVLPASDQIRAEQTAKSLRALLAH